MNLLLKTNWLLAVTHCNSPYRSKIYLSWRFWGNSFMIETVWKSFKLVHTVIYVNCGDVWRPNATHQWTLTTGSYRRVHRDSNVHTIIESPRVNALLRCRRAFPAQLLTNVAPANILVLNLHRVIWRKPAAFAVTNSLAFQPTTYDTTRSQYWLQHLL